MYKVNHYLSNKQKRQRRVRSKIFGVAVKPRLSFNRSNKNLYIQLINDEKAQTIVGLLDKAVIVKSKEKLTKTQKAVETAKVLVTTLKEKKIKSLVVDRGSYQYHGRIKAFVEVLRKNKIKV
jgi:large subunit ribosomal protein L18